MAESVNNGKILIIARDFPPYHHSVGTVVRMVKLADFLQQQGRSVHVLAAKGEEIGYFGYEDIIRRLSVHYVDDPLRARSNRKHKGLTLKPVTIKRGRRISGYLQKLVDDLAVPDLSVFFVRRYYRAALRIIREQGIQNVLITSPPHSMQLIGLLLKRKLGDEVNLIVDYRDSWNCTANFAKRNPLSQLLSRTLERWVLMATDHFVYVSPPMLKKVNETFFDVTRKSLLVMNGYDPEMKPSGSDDARRNEQMTIGHFGPITYNLYAYRNPEPVLAALLKLQLPIRLVFYGPTEISESWRESLGNAIELKGSVPHRQVIAEMQRMDLLMFFDSRKTGSDEVVSGKFFDYILAQRPILVIGPKGMEVAKLTLNNKLGYYIDIFDERAMLERMRAIYEDWKNGALVSYDSTVCADFSRPNQYSKLLPILR